MVYTYDKGITVYRVDLNFDELSQFEKDSLKTFFEDNADGVMNTFTYVDHHGETWESRFLSGRLEWTEKDDNIWSTNMSMEVSSGSCTVSCEANGCQSDCQSGCESGCESDCESTCEYLCQSGVES